MKIAAFNAKNLGIKKVTDKTVVGYLTKVSHLYSSKIYTKYISFVKCLLFKSLKQNCANLINVHLIFCLYKYYLFLLQIMSQYSVVVILEVMDKSGKAMETLLKELNRSVLKTHLAFIPI